MAADSAKYSDLKEAIVRTIAFFDMFDWPLTNMEVWRHLGVKTELNEVIEALADGITGLESENGFYFLSGRREITTQRQRRYAIADKKFKRALLVAKIYKLVPWIKMIAVGNLMGAHNLKKESDIDFFVITEKGRLWLTRFFCASLAAIFGLRPAPGKSENKICLSFFVSEAGLDLSGLMLENDVYFLHWLAGLTPIYDQEGVYEKFTAANGWLINYLPNWQSPAISKRRDAGESFSGFYHDLIDVFLGGLENRFKKFQLKFMSPALLALMNRDTRVAANDRVIKLHSKDRRREYKDKYQKILNEQLSHEIFR